MKLLNKEPYISVGLVASEESVLRPIGDWEVTRQADHVCYTPRDENSIMEVSGIVFGKDFHWQSLQKRMYRGTLKVYLKPRSDGFRIINKLPLEQYIESVVVSEMHPDAPKEFIKAHAIMSRTWALRKIMKYDNVAEGRFCSSSRIVTWEESDSHTYFDVCSDDHCQRYQGVNEIRPDLAQTIDECRGIILMDAANDIPADTRFSKCCGGETEVFSSCWADTDFYYLSHIEDPYCNPNRISREEKDRLLDSILKHYDRKTKYYRWNDFVRRDLIAANLLKFHNISVGKITDIIPVKYGRSGRITLLRIVGEKGCIEIGKELAIRRLLSESHLYSSSFEIIGKSEDGFTLRGKGWGHGVGLCQIGAATMAYEGKKANEILKFYFPGTKMEKIY